jgi:hypothetical protein
VVRSWALPLRFPAQHWVPWQPRLGVIYPSITRVIYYIGGLTRELTAPKPYGTTNKCLHVLAIIPLSLRNRMTVSTISDMRFLVIFLGAWEYMYIYYQVHIYIWRGCSTSHIQQIDSAHKDPGTYSCEFKLPNAEGDIVGLLKHFVIGRVIFHDPQFETSNPNHPLNWLAFPIHFLSWSTPYLVFEIQTVNAQCAIHYTVPPRPSQSTMHWIIAMYRRTYTHTGYEHTGG